MSTIIIPRSIQAPTQRSQHSRKERSQRCEIFAPLPNRKASHLQIASVPAEERINPKENRYVLMIQPQRVRLCGGRYTADEVFEIARLTKKWDWTLDENNRPHCLARLESLLDSITQRSSKGV